MEVEILDKKENPLLKRVEVTFKAVHKAKPSPTRDELRSQVAKRLKAQKDIVVIQRAEATFGRYETIGYAKVYKEKAQALSVEPPHILVRNRLIEPEAKPAEGEPAAKPEKPAPKAEKPAPKKEEPKREAKPAPKPAKAPGKAEKAPAKPEKKEEKPPKKPGKPEARKPEGKKAEPKKRETK